MEPAARGAEASAPGEGGRRRREGEGRRSRENDWPLEARGCLGKAGGGGGRPRRPLHLYGWAAPPNPPRSLAAGALGEALVNGWVSFFFSVSAHARR